MKVEQTMCDECKVTKGQSNNWYKIGVLTLESGVQLTLGVVPEKSMPGYEVRDICGEMCFHKHIERLILVKGGTPPPIPNRIEEVEYTGV